MRFFLFNLKQCYTFLRLYYCKEIQSTPKLSVMLINRVDRTGEFMRLADHQYKQGGVKTVCVSTCLAYFGVEPDRYNYTQSKNSRTLYKDILRRFSLSVRSRCSEFKIKKRSHYKQNPTLTVIKAALKKSAYTTADKFLVLVTQKRKSHLIVLNGNGQTVIDTAKGMRWNVIDISIVEKK